MQKWSYFSMGIMSGIIAVLLTVVVMQNREPKAYGQGTGGGGGAGESLIIGTGGASGQLTDIVWVVNKHAVNPLLKRASAGADDVVGSKGERLTLACYQVVSNGRMIKLIGVRDISFDMDVAEIGNDKPHVRDIIEELKKQVPSKDNK